MNLGLVIRQALGMAELPADSAHLELAKNECNFIVQDLWYETKADARQSRGTLNTINGADEYVLNKFFDGFVKHTFQGPSSNPRYLDYVDTVEFFRRVRLKDGTTGDPYIYTFGEMVGYDRQLESASKIQVFSSLASKTTGQVSVVNGSNRVLSTTDIFDQNDVGRRFKKSGDFKTYRVGNYISPKEIELIEKYRGSTSSGSDYEIGDVGVRVNIQGFVSGEIQSEDITLNGSNVIVSTKTFNSITSISKSDITGGKVTIQNEGGSLTVGSMAPNETEIERQTVLLWPKPDSAESLTYRFYMKHPHLWLDTDRFLIPNKWHRLIARKLEKKLRDSFGKQVPQTLIDEIAKNEEQFENEAEDMSLMDGIPDGDDRRYGDSFYFDKIE